MLSHLKNLKKRQCYNKKTCLKSTDSKIEHETSKLLSITKLFYENRFKSKNIENDKITDYLKDVQLENKLSEDDAKLCENDLSSEECFSVINNMKTNNLQVMMASW